MIIVLITVHSGSVLFNCVHVNTINNSKTATDFASINIGLCGKMIPDIASFVS